MRIQLLEFNSGTIDEMRIFGDRFKLFQANYAKLRVKLNKLRV